MQTLVQIKYPPGYQSHLDCEHVHSRAYTAWDLLKLAEYLVEREDHRASEAEHRGFAYEPDAREVRTHLELQAEFAPLAA